MTSPWKLRFAPHIGLTSLDTPLFKAAVGSDDPVAQIEHAADRGFAGIEDNLLKLRSVADQERIGAALARRGLEMGCFVGNADAWNAKLWGRNDDEARAKLNADLQSSIDVAARVGGKYLTTISGRDLAVPLWAQHQAMIENLKRLAPRAEQAGVVLGIEPTNEQGFPGMLVHHVGDAYAIVKAVDSPAVRLVFDAFHVQVMDGDLIQNLERTFDAIGIVQIADNPGRLEPGTGEINFVHLLRRLRTLGYTGLVELEHEVSGVGAAGEAAALQALRAINDAI
jgi:hydroxypyruvate isomerase